MMCLGVDLFGSNLFRTLCASWTYMAIFFAKYGKFSFINFSNKFSISCSSSSPSGIPMVQILVWVEMSQRHLILSSFFLILFYSCCSSWMLISFLCSKSLIWILALSPPLLVPYIFFPILISVNFISSWVFLISFSRVSISSLSLLPYSMRFWTFWPSVF